MMKKKEFKVEDSNVAGLGSAEDKAARVAAAGTEKAWAKAGKKPGMQIWRIEKFKVKKSMTPHGQFYNDDSYICLNTYQKKDETGKLLDKLFWDVHFWLGKTTSQDEYGTAAYKTVELDDFLGGGPVQHRECSGFESGLFCSYFEKNGGLQMLEGGVESGFNHVEPEKFRPRLLHLKGRKNIRVEEVDFSMASLNSGDVFILDMGLELIQWQGKSAGKNEKARAGQLGRAIDDERRGKPELTVLAQTDKDCVEEFYCHFPDYEAGKEASITDNSGSDSAYETESFKKLYNLSDSSGTMLFNEIELKDNKVTRDMFDTNDAYIFDIGMEVFVWCGNGASKQEKALGLQYAQEYLKKVGKSPKIPVCKIHEGGENEVFEGNLDR